MNQGDALARGASKASFTTSGREISQADWDAMWAQEAPQEEVKEEAKPERETART